MSVIEEVRRDREDLARVLKKHSGIRRIVEDLYPDSAHFIYELLQNAEDTGATEARFALADARLAFEHNGRAFEPRDVYAITDIGEGTKAGAGDKIGRFGVGFKAVFAYSESPHIWSPTFSFKITELVLPSELPPRADLGGRTRFEFPFNNPKKSAAAAFAEVRDGLTGLAETAVLFLPRLSRVTWQIGSEGVGEVRRVRHSDHHVEVFKRSGDETTVSSHFLKFERPVEGLDQQRLAVAFALDFLPGRTAYEASEPLAKQLKVVPAEPGKVAVFFPAEKEASGLRFHLHAPFVPELSRASIKDTPANLPLFDQLAGLAAAALHDIRDLGLLTADFLGVLPNTPDQLGWRYDPIRAAVIAEMNDQPLTPTHAKSHAPAKLLVQGKASLKSLLDDEDIRLLLDYEGEPLRWAAGVPQKSSNADRMLESLDVAEWDVDDFVERLANGTALSDGDGPLLNVASGDVTSWLGGKTVAWHQQLYALLFTDYLVAAPIYRREERAAALGALRIVRLTAGTHATAGESFFGSDEGEHDGLLRRASPGTYTTGKSRAEKENARAFLEEIGVRDVGATEVVEMILKNRYTYEAAVPDEETYRKDLLRFVELVETEPDRASLFSQYYIFKRVAQWGTPSQVYIDQPYQETGLNAYYTPAGDDADRSPLNDMYQSCGINSARLVEFALAVGATARLSIEQTHCRANPDAAQLVWAARGNRTRHGVDVDHHVPGLAALLNEPTAALSRLVWRTLCEQEDDSWTVARYRNNSSCPVQRAPSQLVHVLRSRAWVPQTDGRFVRPCEATRDLLPGGFTFDSGWEWPAAIEFGQQSAERSEEQRQRQELAKELGFDDEDTITRARQFAALPAARQQEILAECERRTPVELPEREPANPARRTERVAELAAEAPERRTEERARSVSIDRDAVKKEAGEYLCQQYTTADGEMICQACRDRLPFKLDDGRDYFERVELLPELKSRLKQNYVALCPTHAAMFRHANGSTDELARLLAEAAGNEITVVLARRDAVLYFTKAHLIDLKAIINLDRHEATTAEVVVTGEA